MLMPIGILVVIFFALAACLVVWIALIERWISGKPVLSYRPRRRVPWGFFDLLAIMFFSCSVMVGLSSLAKFVVPDASDVSIDIDTVQTGNESLAHPIIQLLSSESWPAVILCGLIGVVMAPVGEELLFRVFFQGWLENVERRLRRRATFLRKLLPLSAMPIFVSSFFFALAHFREAKSPEEAEMLIRTFVVYGSGVVLTLVFAVVWVRMRAGATAADLGWSPEDFGNDIQLGIVTYLAIAAPLFGISILAGLLLPKTIAADPIPIFFFAIFLGVLYYRTHRLVPSIVLHMALNASSLSLFFLLNMK